MARLEREEKLIKESIMGTQPTKRNARRDDQITGGKQALERAGSLYHGAKKICAAHVGRYMNETDRETQDHDAAGRLAVA